MNSVSREGISLLSVFPRNWIKWLKHFMVRFFIFFLVFAIFWFTKRPITAINAMLHRYCVSGASWLLIYFNTFSCFRIICILILVQEDCMTWCNCTRANSNLFLEQGASQSLNEYQNPRHLNQVCRFCIFLFGRTFVKNWSSNSIATFQPQIVLFWGHNWLLSSMSRDSVTHQKHNRDVTHIRRRRRGRRLVKNVFLFYFEISHLLRSIQCVCWY